MNGHTRAEMEAAPTRAWDKKSTYSQIYLLPSRKKHDSGWHLIAIVGVVVKGETVTLERAAYCDDICWKLEPPLGYYALRMDMTHPGGIVRVWGGSFCVGASLSSTDVIVRKAEKQ